MRNQFRRLERTGNLFPSFFNYYMNDNLMQRTLPATNITENEKEFKVELSVPGFNKEDIKIEIEKDILKVSAHSEVKNEEKDEAEKILRQEFKSSSFSRSFVLPENIDTENISASQNDGILNITLPKVNKAIEDKVKKIEIK